MEILGVGTDIIEIGRIRRAVESNPRFAKRVFTEAELDYCMSMRDCCPHLAARFAAKEAVAKAFGRSFSWQDVEIAKDGRRPLVKLSGEAAEAAKGCAVMLSMSHSRDYATATAVLVRS